MKKLFLVLIALFFASPLSAADILAVSPNYGWRSFLSNNAIGPVTILVVGIGTSDLAEDKSPSYDRSADSVRAALVSRTEEFLSSSRVASLNRLSAAKMQEVVANLDELISSFDYDPNTLRNLIPGITHILIVDYTRAHRIDQKRRIDLETVRFSLLSLKTLQIDIADELFVRRVYDATAMTNQKPRPESETIVLNGKSIL